MIPALLLEQVNQNLSWAVHHRRYLHQHPELSRQEANTSRYCQQVLESLGYTLKPAFEYGFYADLAAPGAVKRIAFRAEMDALPIVEQTQLTFRSQNPGVAHSCGHDVHMAIALLTAKVLKEQAAALKCHVRFIFQPNEEELPGGARGMIAFGCLQGVDEIYGLHTTTQAKVGEIWIREGTLMGTSCPFRLDIKGKGCHAATPEAGLNPIAAAAELIPLWHLIPTSLATEFPPVLTVTAIHSGNTNNVVPETLTLEGALRAFSTEDVQAVQHKMQASLKFLDKQGYHTDLHFQPSYNCVNNRRYGFGRVLTAAESLVGLIVQANFAPLRFVEDFCYYLEACPGAFYFLGAGNPDKKITYPLHSPRYDVDEEALGIGASLMALLALGLS